MRTFGTFLVAVIFAGAAGCGSSSSTGTDSSTPGPGLDAGTGADVSQGVPDVSLGSPDVSSGTGIDMGPSGTSIDGSFTSPTGRTPATGGMCPGSTTGQVCTGEQAYLDCLTAACGTQAKACFGNNYLKGDYTGGVCGQFISCEMACPCDATGTNCVLGCAAQFVLPMPDCLACTGTLQSCTTAAGCVEPVCTTIDAGIPTNTSIDAGTTTGGNCLSLQVCCSSMPSTVAPTCQAALSAASGVDATCATIIQGFQANGYCGGTTSTTTATSTTTSTTTATSTATGANCAAAQACCASVPAAMTATCQTSLTSAGGVEAACAAIVSGFQSAGYCGGTTSTTTATATTTSTSTSTSTATATATGTGCVALQACCASLPSTVATACQTVLLTAGGADSTCTVGLQQFQNAGYCK